MEEADDEVGSTPGLTGDSCPVWSTVAEDVWVIHVDIGEGERRMGLERLSSEGLPRMSDHRRSRVVDGMARGVERAIIACAGPEGQAGGLRLGEKQAESSYRIGIPRGLRRRETGLSLKDETNVTLPRERSDRVVCASNERASE